MLPMLPEHTAGRKTARWRRSAVLLAFALTCLAASACQSRDPSGNTNRAGLLILHGDGTLRQACVAFSESTVSGYELLTRSGLEAIVDPRNAMGVLVCSLDGEGCSFPEEDCLCACRGAGPCRYWAYFTLAADGSWTYSPVGPSMRRVSDGDVDAWVWLTSTGPGFSESTALPSFTAADICGPLSPIPESR